MGGEAEEGEVEEAGEGGKKGIATEGCGNKRRKRKLARGISKKQKGE